MLTAHHHRQKTSASTVWLKPYFNTVPAVKDHS